MSIVVLAKSQEEIQLCYPVMVQLRSQFSIDQFTEQVQLQMASGYQLAYWLDENFVKAVAGFRINTNLAWGKFLYVDDLVTDEGYRSTGAGSTMFEWLVDFAKYNQCSQLHLDSGVQRFDAHRFYLKKGMIISSHHFTLQLEPPALT